MPDDEFTKENIEAIQKIARDSIGDKKSTDEIIETFDRIASDISSKVITGLIQKVMN